ncbi:hypothetical protein, partial [Agrobacterium tumefaciens]|uniref:hypothetical protein n=1 Tax=Agrobacterium tumefaciens TaxID=358 RepID=UPI001AEBE0E8
STARATARNSSPQTDLRPQTRRSKARPNRRAFSLFRDYCHFSEKIFAYSRTLRPVTRRKQRHIRLSAISRSQNPFNRLKASANLRRHKNDDRQNRKNGRCDHMSLQNPCKTA